MNSKAACVLVSKLACDDPLREWDFSAHVLDCGFVRIDIAMRMRDVDRQGAEMQLVEPLILDLDSMGFDASSIIIRIRGTMSTMLEHELDEWFTFMGRNYRDPHPKLEHFNVEEASK